MDAFQPIQGHTHRVTFLNCGQGGLPRRLRAPGVEMASSNEKPPPGLFANRRSRCAREERFSRAWEEENVRYGTLAGLLGRPPTDEEAVLASTLIQWLGTECGQFFLGTLKEDP